MVCPSCKYRQNFACTLRVHIDLDSTINNPHITRRSPMILSYAHFHRKFSSTGNSVFMNLADAQDASFFIPHRIILASSTLIVQCGGQWSSPDKRHDHKILKKSDRLVRLLQMYIGGFLGNVEYVNTMGYRIRNLHWSCLIYQFYTMVNIYCIVKTDVKKAEPHTKVNSRTLVININIYS